MYSKIKMKAYMTSLQAAATASAVIPNFSYKTGPGALAPKVSTPMDFPLVPTNFSHPKVLPASILTRAVTDEGKIDSL